MADATVKPQRIRWKRRIGTVLVLFVLLINAMAFMQAWKMTHFAPPGSRAHTRTTTIGEKAWALFFGLSIPRPMNQWTPERVGFPFETLRFASSDGVQLEAWHIPAADHSRGLVIGFHGYGSAKGALMPEAGVLHKMHFDVMLVDFRGSGGSSGDETSVGYSEAEDVAAALKFAQKSFHPGHVILYGKSMGSAAILRAGAVCGIQPDAMILECPYDRLLDTVANRFTTIGLPSFPLARMLMFWSSIQEWHWAFGMNPIDYASRLRSPVLDLNGGLDPWVNPAESHALFDRMTGEKTYVCFDGIGHDGYYTHQPAKWTAVVSQFLSRFQ